jgi:hypothetical protein
MNGKTATKPSRSASSMKRVSAIMFCSVCRQPWRTMTTGAAAPSLAASGTKT